ncbi:hypothetical protein RIF29_23430 [Crotalaria pallida]|uniref:MLO-like protein n=1 Tax=Crotalaria pallida TaxID=3830 RepID=A0AAN9I8L0_CROPI
MDIDLDKFPQRKLAETPTWAVAAVCFAMLAISIFIEHLIEAIGKWLKKRHKKALHEALEKGKVAFVSQYGIHQLHIFIFVLAIFHILQCIITLGLGRTKMGIWKKWEEETKTVEHQCYNDPERFRFARDTTFGRRHLNSWTKSPISLWIVSFFRQFYGSVDKVDYTAHLAPGSEAKFNFQKYIQRSLEEDFKVVVGISPTIWFFAVLTLLTNTNGWYPYLWLPFIPLIILLLVGTELQMIITKMGLRIQERGDVVKGAPVVEPGDYLFWFRRPRLILFLIHLVLFQMGSTMKPTIFNDRVAKALKNWHHTARKHVRHNKVSSHSGVNTPLSSYPTTPTHGMSPVHLLYKHPGHSDSPLASPRALSSPIYENEKWDAEGSNSPSNQERRGLEENLQLQIVEPGSTDLPPIRAQHKITMNLSEFEFEPPHNGRD